MIIIYSTAIGGELATGKSTPGQTSTNNSADVVMANACPTALNNWVKDDYTNKTNWFGVPFPSEAKTCTSSIQSYKDYIKRSGQKTSLSEAEDFSSYLADRYKQVAPSAKASLSRCNALPNGQDKVAKTRYYMAMEKFESYNTSIVDELAYIDSFDSKNSGLSRIECNPQFPFPKLAQRCDEYKKKINGTACKVTPEQRMDQLVSSTYSALDQVDKLEKAYNKCVREIPVDKCAAIKIVSSRISAENPWIESSQFSQIRGSMRYKAGWQRNYNREALKRRITGYFSESREILVKQHNSNLKHVRCMSYTTTESGSDCKFEDTRELLDSIPDIPDLTDKRIQKNREFDTYIQAEKCLLDRGMDRENTRRIVTDSGNTAVITVLTAGLSAVGAGGLKVMQGMSTVNRLRSAAGALTLTAGVNLGVGVKQAVESCSKESEATLKFSGTPEAMSENICPDFSSKLQLAKDAESSCMVDALLASADVWPFVKGLNMVGKQFTRQALLDLYKDPKQREAVEAILKRNGQLTDPERVDAAETLLGKKLSQSEKNCVLNAHSIGAGKYMKTAESEALGVPLLSTSDLLEKKNTLTGCGFQVTDVALLMRAGITGSTPDGAKTFIRQASVKLFGRDLNSSQVDAIWDASGKTREDQVRRLTAAGFSEADATRIANRELDKLSQADVRSVVLKEQPLVVSAKPIVPPAPKPTANASLTDAFERQDADKIKAAYAASRDEAVQITTKNRAEVVASPNKILDLSTQGLKVDESADLMKAALAGDDGFKKAMGLIDERVTMAGKNYSFQNEYNQFRLQELKVKLMDDFYTTKFKDKWHNLDVDRFYDADEAGFEAYKKATEKLNKMKEKGSKRWPS